MNWSLKYVPPLGVREPVKYTSLMTRSPTREPLSDCRTASVGAVRMARAGERALRVSAVRWPVSANACSAVSVMALETTYVPGNTRGNVATPCASATAESLVLRSVLVSTTRAFVAATVAYVAGYSTRTESGNVRTSVLLSEQAANPNPMIVSSGARPTRRRGARNGCSRERRMM